MSSAATLVPRGLSSVSDDDTLVFPRGKYVGAPEEQDVALLPTDPFSKAEAPALIPTQLVTPGQGQDTEDARLPPPGLQSAGGQPADTLFGNFQTVRKIGQGGMGIVYEARHLKIGSRAAIKIMHKELAQNADYAARFLNEARAVNIVQHRGLVEIFEYGQLQDGTLFIVMEYLQGQSLRERLTERKKFTEGEATYLALQIARALAAAHAKGIVHRDLKPENVMLVPDPVAPETDWVKILDFGIAKVDPKARQAFANLSDRPTQVGSIMGTPNYMAPEQFGRAEEVDGRADVFSLGVMLYELLAGESPHAERPPQLAYQPKPPLQKVNSTVSARLETLIERMLRVTAAERPTMDQVAKELAGMRPSGVQARSPLTRPRLLVGAAVAALVGGLTTIVLVRSRPPTPIAAKRHALAVLQAGLHSDKPAQQVRAIRALGRSGDLNQRALLEPQLQSRNPQAVEEAVRALGQIGAVGARPALLGLLKRPHPTSLEVTIADALARLQDPDGLKMLADTLAKEDPELKLRAATLLLDHGNLSGAPLLWERIARASLLERASPLTIGQLAQAGDARARHFLEETLRRAEKSPARLFSAWSLGKLGDDRGRAVLLEAAGQPGSDQLLANQLLAALGEPIGSDLLTAVARSPKEPDDHRELAITGLADCGREDAITMLDSLLSKGSTSEVIRIASAGAILRLISGEPTQLAQQSLSWAKAALDSDSAITRELAAASLGEINSSETIQPLGQALRDRQHEVRRTAARALGKKSVREALDVLVSSLDDQNVEVRAAGLHAISRVVSSLRRKGDKDTDRLVVSRLELLARDGSEQDRVVASGILLQLGDTAQQGRLHAALASRDPLVRALALDMSDAGQGLFERALTDNDHSVKLAAARRLADQGSRLGVTVLQEAVQGGGLEGLIAYGKLKKLGEQAESPEGLAELLQSADLQVRLDVLDAVAELPSERALSLLYIASRDFASVVRRRVAEVASGFYKRTGSSAFVNLIRILLHDPDVLVRSGATDLLLPVPKLTKPSPASGGAPVASPRRPESLPKPTSSALADESPLPSPPAPEAPVAVAKGQIRLIGDALVRVQIDHSPPRVLSSKPIAVTAGRHQISYLGGTQAIAVGAGETATIKVPTTAAEQLLHDGIEAHRAKQLDRAQGFLERIKHLEQRGSVKRTLLPDVAYNLGRVYEDKREIGKALQEYSRLRAMAALQHRPELRAGLDQAMARLAPTIGHIVLSRRDQAGQCVQVDLYLPPGTHSIDLGLGKPELVRAQAGVTTPIVTCQR